MGARERATDLTRLVREWDREDVPDGLLREVQASVRSAIRAARIGAPGLVGIDGREWGPESRRQAALEFFSDQVLQHFDTLHHLAACGGISRGYLHRMAQRWLIDRQRARDPRRSANFRGLRAGVNEAIQAGRLMLEPGGAGKLDKHSLLWFPGADRHAEPWSASHLASAAMQTPVWPGLRDYLRGKGEAVPAGLSAVLERLAHSGCPGFVFADLLDGLHGAAAIGAGTDIGDLDAVSERPTDVSAPLDFLERVARMRDAIDRSGMPASRVALLHQLAAEFVVEAQGGDPVNAADFGRRVGLSRQRVAELRQDLKTLFSSIALPTNR